MTRGSLCLAVAVTVGLGSMVNAATLTFRQGANGYAGTVDTFLKESTPGTSQSTLAVVEWDADDPPGTGLANYGLIRFDGIFGAGFDQIPAGSQITSATLTYTIVNGGHPADLHEVSVDWDASTTYNTFGASPGVQSSDYGLASAPAPGSIATHTVDVTGSIAVWVNDPAGNRGWIALPTGVDGVEFRSSEYAVNPALRPLLTAVINEGQPQPTLVRRPYLQRGTPTAMTVVWRTDFASTSRVRYGLDPLTLTQEISDASLVVDHVVTLSGLTANTRYYYDVGTTDAPLAGGDADHYFTTPPEPGTRVPFTAWVVGDSGTGDVNQANVRNAMLSVTGSTPPNIFVHVGDMAYNAGTDGEFTDNFFAPYEGILSHTVCWPSLGNHEGASSDSGTQAGPYYESYVLPTAAQAGGLPSGTEAYYSFDHAHVHFVCLDSHDTSRTPGSAMLIWLAEDIAATDQEWLIAFWHHPPYTKGTHNSDNIADSGGRMRDMRQNVLPILEAGGVDVVLGGHSHIYERSFLVDGAYDTPTTAPGHILDGGDGMPAGGGAYTKSAGLDANQGSVYIVAGHGGAGVGGAGNHPLMYFSETANGSCLLDVDANTLTLRNVRADGAITNTVQIIKQGDPGDFDNDADVDTDDYNAFVACFTGPGGGPIDPGCASGDFDADGDIDCDDWIAFVNAWTELTPPPQLPPCFTPGIPTVSQWSVSVLALTLLVAGTIVFASRRPSRVPA